MASVIGVLTDRDGRLGRRADACDDGGRDRVVGPPARGTWGPLGPEEAGRTRPRAVRGSLEVPRSRSRRLPLESPVCGTSGQ